MLTATVPSVRIELDEGLRKKLADSEKVLVIYATLKFSCMIAKYFRAELLEEPPEDSIPFDVDGTRVFIRFRAVGSRFCGGDVGFEEFDFPIKYPEKFFPKWVRVNSDLSGEFGYA